MDIGILGTGSIASALVEGIAPDGHRITVSERSATRAARLAGMFANVRVAPNQEVLDTSEVVFLGLLAAAAPKVLKGLRFRPDQRIISLMAGATLAELAPLVAPARAVAIALPFPGIAEGGSPVLLMGEDEPARTILGARNPIFVMQTAQELQAYLCAQAVLSPAVALVGETAGWLGARVENAAQAEAFLRTLIGTSLLGSAVAPLLQALDTPGGYNQRLRAHMQGHGMGAALISGLDALERGD